MWRGISMDIYFYIYDMAEILGAIAGAAIGLLLVRRYKQVSGGQACRVSQSTCVDAHKSSGGNYIWLREKYGDLLKVEFEEPAGSGYWREYNDHWWEVHCKVISHDPSKLYAEHIATFVDPNTRTISLRFTFRKDGYVYTTAPTPDFYILERDWFMQHGCT